MCNEWHQDTAARPRRVNPVGKGYKLFFMTSTGTLQTAVHSSGNYDCNTDGWITWRWHGRQAHQMGFCAFTTKKQAQRARDAWLRSTGTPLKIFTIQYRGALGTCDSQEMCRGVKMRFLIVKAFKPGKEVRE